MCVFSGGFAFVNIHLQQRITITKQDVVRWCINATLKCEPRDTIEFYCRNMRGYEYINEGVIANYDKYPWLDSDWIDAANAHDANDACANEVK